MPIQLTKVTIAVVYVAVIGAAGLAGGVNTAPAWSAVAALALLPAIGLLTLWDLRGHPSETLSEAIQAARR